jgi:hypothetical protein
MKEVFAQKGARIILETLMKVREGEGIRKGRDFFF